LGAQEEPPHEIISVPKVALVELILLKQFRGSGIGRRLMVEALSGRPESLATLLARSDAPAIEMYLRLGWRRLGTVQAQPHWPAYDALVFDLTAGLPTVDIH
jgi:ribosomal protein S18 acetylase RimI-like enzyme